AFTLAAHINTATASRTPAPGTHFLHLAGDLMDADIPESRKTLGLVEPLGSRPYLRVEHLVRGTHGLPPRRGCPPQRPPVSLAAVAGMNGEILRGHRALPNGVGHDR